MRAKWFILLFTILTSLCLAQTRPDYALSVTNPELPVWVGASTGQVATGHINLQNTGNNDDTYQITVVVDEPVAGMATFCSSTNCFGATAPLTITAGASDYIYVDLFPQGAAQMKFHIQITSPNIEAITIYQEFISEDADVVVVANQGPALNAALNVLSNTDLRYGVWNLQMAPLSQQAKSFANIFVLENTNEVVINSDVMTWLTSWLDQGGNLMVSGNTTAQRLGSMDNSFMPNYLHATWQSQQSNTATLEYVEGDVVANDMQITVNPQGNSTGVLAPTDGAFTVYNYPNQGGVAAVRAVHNNVSKVLFTGYGLETIADWYDLAYYTANVMYWFDLSFTDTEDQTAPVVTGISSNYPNPFNPSTTIYFEKPGVTQFGVQVYNLRGQLVRSYHNVNAAQGKAGLEFNGQDNNGTLLPSGMYMYRITGAGYTKTHKMLMLK